MIIIVSNFQNFKNEVFTVFSQVTLNSAEICSTVVDEDCGFSSNPKDNWTIALPDVPKPPVVPVTPPKVLQMTMISPIISITNFLHIFDRKVRPYCKYYNFQIFTMIQNI